MKSAAGWIFVCACDGVVTFSWEQALASLPEEAAEGSPS